MSNLPLENLAKFPEMINVKNQKRIIKPENFKMRNG